MVWFTWVLELSDCCVADLLGLAWVDSLLLGFMGLLVLLCVTGELDCACFLI